MVMNHHTASSTVAADRDQAVVLQNRGLVLADRLGDPLAFVELDRDAAEIVVERVIVVEGADVLGDRRERAPERRKGPAVGRVGMGGGDRVGPRRVDARMNDEGRRVDRIIALDDIALVVAADQVRDLDLAEMDAERIDPERVRKLGIARGDVARDPLVEAEFREQPEPGGKPLLAMQPLFARGSRTSAAWAIFRFPAQDWPALSSPWPGRSSSLLPGELRLPQA